MPSLDTIDTTTPLIGLDIETDTTIDGLTLVSRRCSPSPSRAAVSRRFSTGPTNGPCSWRPTASSHRSGPGARHLERLGFDLPFMRRVLGFSACLLVSSPGTTHRSPGATIRCRASRAECGAGGIGSATSMAFRRTGPTSGRTSRSRVGSSRSRNLWGSNPSRLTVAASMSSRRRRCMSTC